MAGHIALPHYQQKLNPELADADILPATLADELLNGLLKTQLGFNGAIITDASHMLGMTSAMRRRLRPVGDRRRMRRLPVLQQPLSRTSLSMKAASRRASSAPNA